MWVDQSPVTERWLASWPPHCADPLGADIMKDEARVIGVLCEQLNCGADELACPPVAGLRMRPWPSIRTGEWMPD